VGAAVITGVARDRGWIRVGTFNALEHVREIYLPEPNVFVVANGAHPVALSASGPHLGERLLFCKASGYFQDGHGDRFDRFGRYALGPAPRGMTRVEVRIRDGLVEVKPASTTPGLPRHGPPPLRPVGPFCGDDQPEGAPGFFRA
jgi:Rieske Fe-S protein